MNYALKDGRKFHRARKGTIAIEYAVIAGLLAAPFVVGADNLGATVQNAFAAVAKGFPAPCVPNGGKSGCEQSK
jgi:Flp pilus assembly pilin Flp